MNTAKQLKQSVSLLQIVEGLVTIQDADSSSLDVIVSGVQMDSRLLQQGDLFIACFGRNHDARDFINEAVDMGAAAVLAEASDDWVGVKYIENVPVLAVDNLFSKISEIASRFYSHPSQKLNVIGITGTNGKTSCCQFIAQALNSMNLQCGTIGTLGYGVYGALKETQLTTPDAVFTQKALAEMAEEGIDPVVMEVSSVGLHQRRVKAVHFDTAVFTNLSRDHLDYHESMEDYGKNKKKLFQSKGLRQAVVNLDDPYALSVINSIPKCVEISTYSINNKIASVYAEEVNMTRKGFEARISTPIGEGNIEGSLLGYFNFSNLLAVITTLISYLSKQDDLNIEKLCSEVSAIKPVDGRMEIISGSDDITAVVDYAHTPDGLRSALLGLRDHFDGDIWCVFGCGGNRDKGKRPLMGEVAEQYANKLLITDDNPRNETGDKIVQHILSGIVDPQKAQVIRDRAEAISYAIANAKSGDVVLVAGKGHETYQDIEGTKLIFSDANQVRLALQARNGRSTKG